MKRLDQESNLDLNLRRVRCDPLHHRDHQRPDPESNPLEPGCGRWPCLLAPASSVKRPRQELNLVFDLRGVACDPAHSEDSLYAGFLAPRRGIEPRLAESKSAVLSGTLAGQNATQCLDQESNLDLNLRRVRCDPLHHRDIQRPDPESNQDQDLRRVLCVPLHHRDNPHSKPTTGFAPA